MDYLVAPEQYETPEFTIRGYHPGDGALLFEAVDTSRDHLRTYMPWVDFHKTVEDSERFVRQSRGHYLMADEFTLGMFSPDGKRLLGGTGYHLRWGNLSTRTSEVGMWIRADAAHQGLGPKVLKALIDWGFTDWPWLKLIWRCDAENKPSFRTAEKAGMNKEGFFRGDDFDHHSDRRRDTIYYGLTKDEWSSKK